PAHVAGTRKLRPRPNLQIPKPTRARSTTTTQTPQAATKGRALSSCPCISGTSFRNDYAGSPSKVSGASDTALLISSATFPRVRLGGRSAHEANRESHDHLLVTSALVRSSQA